MLPPPPALAPFIDRLTAWSAINSGSDHPAGLARMADALEAALCELTPHVERLPVAPYGRVALLARQRPELTRRVLCSGHYDTVFAADHPFQTPARLNETTLRGPGVADMKGGIVVMLVALAAFERTPVAADLGWDVLLTPDEEIGSLASRPLLERLAPIARLGLVFEPARPDGRFVRSRKGTGGFTVTCRGRAAHAGNNPAAGRNAILALAEYLLAIASLPQRLPGVLLNVGAISGGSDATNIVPDLAVAELDIRTADAAGTAAVLAALEDHARPLRARDGFQLTLEGQFNRLPFTATPVTDQLFAALQRCALDLGQPPLDWVDVGGGSDSNLLAATGLPCLDGFGPIGGGLHTSDEYVELPSLAARTQLATLFLHRLATQEIPLP